jgi:Protein of unknown function (DUF4231)
MAQGEASAPVSGPEANAHSRARPDGASGSPVWERLEDQIDWYDRKSQKNQRRFKQLKVCQIVVAAVIPVLAAVPDAPVWLLGGLGAFIVVLEGLQQLQQYQQNWTSYRTTCERLNNEKFLFIARAGSYAVAPKPEALLAERVEGVISKEHAGWVSHRHEAASRMEGEH